MWDVTFDEGRG
jgi:hypothetical protein